MEDNLNITATGTAIPHVRRIQQRFFLLLAKRNSPILPEAKIRLTSSIETENISFKAGKTITKWPLAEERRTKNPENADQSPNTTTIFLAMEIKMPVQPEGYLKPRPYDFL